MCQADIILTNQNGSKQSYLKEDESSDATNSVTSDLNSDEDFEDFKPEGYHPTHTG